MNAQPTLARTAPAKTFYYVQVCADRSDAHREMSAYAATNARSFEVVHVEPAQDEDECDVCVFVVYASALPSPVEADDNLHDLYTLPHLVNAPCFDIDDLTN